MSMGIVISLHELIAVMLSLGLGVGVGLELCGLVNITGLLWGLYGDF